MVENRVVDIWRATLLDETVREYLSDLLWSLFLIKNINATIKMNINKAEARVFKHKSHQSGAFVPNFTSHAKFNLWCRDISKLLTDSSLCIKSDADAN